MAGNKLTVLKGQLTRYKNNGYLYQYKETLNVDEKKVFESLMIKKNISIEDIEQVLTPMKNWCNANNRKLSKLTNNKESIGITLKISMHINNFKLYIESIASNMNEIDIELLKKQIELIIDGLYKIKKQKIKEQLKYKLNELSKMNESINELKLKLTSK